MSMIEITKADRDAAANYWAGWSNNLPEVDGEIHPLVFAFARHRHEARAEALGEALTTIALLPTGKTEDVMEGHEQAYRAIEALRSG